MNTQEAYNHWSKTYDEVNNKTRDLEADALREILSNIKIKNVLEIGCGTGKNTEWFLENAQNITSVDLSEEMLAKAKSKVNSDKVTFVQADITQDWDFAKNKQYDLIGFSLVLEHIGNLEPIFSKVTDSLAVGGYLYIGELHPFKQYNGTKARFETENGTQIVDCFNHHVSDFVNFGLKNGLKLVSFNEYFDENNRNNLPRILALLFQKL
jgi:SAM-dependent methyltransferase